jgi:hypothetical protein
VSNTPIIIVLVASVSLIVLLGCLAMFVLARLRRMIRLQSETIEKLLSAVPAEQGQDKPAEPG